VEEIYIGRIIIQAYYIQK